VLAAGPIDIDANKSPKAGKPRGSVRADRANVEEHGVWFRIVMVSLKKVYVIGGFYPFIYVFLPLLFWLIGGIRQYRRSSGIP